VDAACASWPRGLRRTRVHGSHRVARRLPVDPSSGPPSHPGRSHALRSPPSGLSPLHRSDVSVSTPRLPRQPFGQAQPCAHIAFRPRGSSPTSTVCSTDPLSGVLHPAPIMRFIGFLRPGQPASRLPSDASSPMPCPPEHFPSTKPSRATKVVRDRAPSPLRDGSASRRSRGFEPGGDPVCPRRCPGRFDPWLSWASLSWRRFRHPHTRRCAGGVSTGTNRIRRLDGSSPGGGSRHALASWAEVQGQRPKPRPIHSFRHRAIQTGVHRATAMRDTRTSVHGPLPVGRGHPGCDPPGRPVRTDPCHAKAIQVCPNSRARAPIEALFPTVVAAGPKAAAPTLAATGAYAPTAALAAPREDMADALASRHACGDPFLATHTGAARPSKPPKRTSARAGLGLDPPCASGPGGHPGVGRCVLAVRSWCAGAGQGSPVVHRLEAPCRSRVPPHPRGDRSDAIARHRRSCASHRGRVAPADPPGSRSPAREGGVLLVALHTRGSRGSRDPSVGRSVR